MKFIHRVNAIDADMEYLDFDRSDFPEDLVGCINYPNFESPDSVLDWRKYVPDNLRRHWSRLTLSAKLIAIYMAHRGNHN